MGLRIRHDHDGVDIEAETRLRANARLLTAAIVAAAMLVAVLGLRLLQPEPTRVPSVCFEPETRNVQAECFDYAPDALKGIQVRPHLFVYRWECARLAGLLPSGGQDRPQRLMEMYLQEPTCGRVNVQGPPMWLGPPAARDLQLFFHREQQLWAEHNAGRWTPARIASAAGWLLLLCAFLVRVVRRIHRGSEPVRIQLRQRFLVLDGRRIPTDDIDAIRIQGGAIHLTLHSGAEVVGRPVSWHVALELEEWLEDVDLTGNTDVPVARREMEQLLSSARRTALRS